MNQVYNSTNAFLRKQFPYAIIIGVKKSRKVR